LILVACGGGPSSGGGGDKPGGPEGEAESVAVPIEAGSARKQPIVASYTGTATLEAEREAQVVAKTSGVLLRLRVEEGDRVREGQVLAELDPERPRLQLAQTESNLRRLENDFRRAQELNANKLISAEAFDKIRFDLETQRAAHDLAQLELSYTSIVAPIDGVLSVRMVKEGNLIQLHAPLFRIDDFDPLLAVLNVPERELLTLRPGLAVSMTVDALPTASFVGNVARISPVVDSQTGTFRVTCEFHDETGTLKSGMFGRISVVYDERADALVIPREALSDEDGEAAVFVIVKEEIKPEVPKGEDAKKADPEAKAAKPRMGTVARRRLVKVGYIAGENVEIREGLAEGDLVVTVGRAAVRDGTEVQVLESAK
jgi:membrane fusion protein (multidrug efflux system)